MKGKKSIIISSLIMCLTLIVAIVSVTAAWFGNVTQGEVADLQIGSGTTSASADVDITSGVTSGESLIPALAVAGAYGAEMPYPGNYFVGLEGQEYNADNAKKLDPSNEPDEKIKQGAKSVTFVLSIRYVGPGDENNGNRKTVKLMLLGAYLQKDLTQSGSEGNITYSGYEEADGKGRNFKNEFNVNMKLVANKDGTGDVSTETVNYSDDYSKDNPYGHVLTVQAASTVTYYVKFEIYFNKVEEECNPELLHANLVLHIKLDMGAESSPTQP